MKLLQVKILLILLIVTNLSFAQTVIDVPDIKYVSIDPYSNEIVVAWNASLSNNISFTRVSYILLPGTASEYFYSIPVNKEDSVRFSLDTIDNKKIPTDSIDRALGFAVTVIDINNNGSKSLYSYHTTSYLKSKYESCPDRIIFEWSGYSSGDYAPVNIQSYTLVGTNGNQKKVFAVLDKNTRSLEYTLDDINGYSGFYIYATFKSTDGITYTSRSNMTYTSEVKVEKPQFISINSVSVIEQGIEINVSLDTNSKIENYHIYTSFNQDNNYILTDSTSLLKPVKKENIVTLQNIGSNVINYIKIFALDNCNNKIDSSEIACNIVLTGNDDEKPFENILKWNKFCGWKDTGIKSYTLYRSKEDEDYEVFRYASANSESVTDNVEELSQTYSKFCYYIVAHENNSDFTSTSNKICIEKNPRVFIPNTLLPLSANEENRYFRVYSTFISSEGFELKVYDRWGKLLFNSSNPQESWDGKVNGNYVQQGTYIYNLIYQTSTGNEIEKKGLLNVLYQ